MKLCPICNKPPTTKSTPFCSERCRNVDMNRWFTGAYATPAVEIDDVSEEDLARLQQDDDTAGNA